MRFLGGVPRDYVAMEQVIRDAGLKNRNLERAHRPAMGSAAFNRAISIGRRARSKGRSGSGRSRCRKAMSSTASATLADLVEDQGLKLFDSSAVRLSTIASATLRADPYKQDMTFAGAGEELDWTLTVLFDAMARRRRKTTIRSRRRRAPMMLIATASSSGRRRRAGPEESSMPRRAAHASMPSWPDTRDLRRRRHGSPSGEGAARCMAWREGRKIAG